MSINTSDAQKVIPTRRVLITGLITLFAIAVITGFVWIQTDQVMAPPGLRIMDALWRFFVCRCPDFPDILSSF